MGIHSLNKMLETLGILLLGLLSNQLKCYEERRAIEERLLENLTEFLPTLYMTQTSFIVGSQA